MPFAILAGFTSMSKTAKGGLQYGQRSAECPPAVCLSNPWLEGAAMLVYICEVLDYLNPSYRYCAKLATATFCGRLYCG